MSLVRKILLHSFACAFTFFTFGVNEKRDSGTDFDMNAYLESYAD